MLGLSSSYFGFRGKGIYDSAKAVFDLGFGTVELGAGHSHEKNVWETLHKIKHDFPGKKYTVHGLFPPLPEKHWFNASLGLTKANLGIVEGLFKAAQTAEADIVSIHPGFRKEVGWPSGKHAMVEPKLLKEIPHKLAWQNFFALVEKCLSLAKETGCAFAIENLTRPERDLVFSDQEFETVFEKFPSLKLLLDTGHALYNQRLDSLIEKFGKRVGQIHLHYTRPKHEAKKKDEHLPISSLEQLESLRKIPQFKKIPVIFEHGLDTSPEQVLAEKKLVEQFEKSFGNSD